MNRLSRSHRSTKIPNVKLRPAVRHETQAAIPAGNGASSASSSSGPSRKRQRAHDNARDDLEDDEHYRRLRDDGVDRGAHVDADFIGLSARPLKGAIISMTGLGDTKLVLSGYAREMGARVEGDLTEDVTHLVAERPGSAKYRCALELGMHIVHPDWIAEMRTRWLDGEDVDPEELQESFRLRPLEGLTVAFAGCSGSERRSLKALASSLGATTSDELRFDGSITHLVSSTPDPNASSSIHYVLYFQQRSRNGIDGVKEEAAAAISVVWPEWLDDCQQADGCLDELRYSVFAPPPEDSLRRKLIDQALHRIPSPFLRRSSISTTRAKLGSAQPGQTKPPLAVEEPLAAPKPMRFGDNGDEEEGAIIKLGVNGEGGGERTFARVISQIVSNRPEEHHASSRDGAQAAPKKLPGSTGGLLSISRASSFSQAAPSSTKRTLLGKRKSDERGANDGAADVDGIGRAGRETSAGPVPAPARAPPDPAQSVARAAKGCFAGLVIRIDLADPARTVVLKAALNGAGAHVLSAGQDGDADYCVVSSGPSAAAATPTSSEEASVVPRGARGMPVTHYWIEFCLHSEEFVEPSAYFAATPSRAKLPLSDGPSLKILVVGFAEASPELYHARKLIEELGGTVVDRLRRSPITHVLCATEDSWNGNKATRAAANGVPLVSLDFLQAARMDGRIDPPGRPILVQERSASAGHGGESLSTSHASSSGVQQVRAPFRSTSGGRPEALHQAAAAAASGERGRHTLAPPAGSAGTGIASPSDVLAGCFIACSRSIASGLSAVEKKVFSLGGTFQQGPDGYTTHLLHRGSHQPREQRDVATGSVAVHPLWLDQCYDEGARLDERLFPSTLNPGKALATTVSAPDVEESIGARLGSQATSASQHSAAVAAARPWHRSLSAGTAQKPRSSSRSQAHPVDPADDSVRADLAPLDEELEIPSRGRSASPPAIQHLDADDDVPLGPADGEENEAARKQAPGPQDGADPNRATRFKDGLEDPATADQVMALLRSRALEQSSKRRARQPPRSRKRRSGEADQGLSSPNATHRDSNAVSSATTSSGAPLSSASTAEQVLALQAEREAERAAEAAAYGFSLGLDRVAASMGTQGNAFDASVRVVYDDPAARKERQKLLDLVGQRGSEADGDGLDDSDRCEDRATSGDSETMAEREPGSAAQQAGVVAATAADGRPFGTRRSPRKTESPTKRPVVRRQPLARR